MKQPIVVREVPWQRQDGLDMRARQLAWLGIGWHVFEAAAAIAAGAAAGSIALVGFGADSVVELIAALVVIWRFADERRASSRAELRAQRLIAICFYAIALYVGAEAIQALVLSERPQASWVGIALALVTLIVMPLLARAKSRVGMRLGSSATVSEGRQNLVCAYLAAALLVGLAANALLGWWWGDPLVALLIAAVAIDEGVDAWRGESRAGGCC